MKILKFYTETCAPCKVISKILDKIEGVEIESINALEDIVAVDKYCICTTPTLIFLDGDKEVARMHGLVSEQDIRDTLKKCK